MERGTRKGNGKGNGKSKPQSALTRSQRPASTSASNLQKLNPSTLLAQATSLLHTSQPASAAPLALRALNALRQPSPLHSPTASLPALNLLGEIHIELGEPDTARAYFLEAISLDPEGLIPESEGSGGAEKFLWLAQLSEEGGEESVRWYEKGVGLLKRDVFVLEEAQKGKIKKEGVTLLLEEKRRKLAAALCGVVEVYMTDLSYV